ncbi:hypothetical protein F5Y17DRAFT_440483 [Xylariaceae sp. FL0594]|nr:hypothetical protein F5Y17DRAFT_440483 [Xylariaceae sp. FL0594]
MMDTKVSKYRSRILREMRNNADNPFSPPSSTGSHGTVTLTSQLSLPDDESTRPQIPAINTSVLRQRFPEWETKTTTTTPKAYSPANKENKAPVPAAGALDEDDSIIVPDSPKLRVPKSDTMRDTRGNVTTLLDTLNHSRPEKAAEAKQASSSQDAPKSQLNAGAGFSANAARRIQRSQPGGFSPMSPGVANQTAGSLSFFLPQFSHLNDFVSGTLRLSSLKNGTPVFVKHGKVHDRDTKTSFDHHADFEAIPISNEEEKIFVSLDKIREEIQTLQEHDEFVSKQAEQLQEEVVELQSHVTTLKARKDSALGSESDGSAVEQLTSQKSQLEEQVASLRSRLDQANRQISLNEIHKESFVAERDEALQRASDHVATIKRLQARNDSITAQKLDLQQALKESEEELDSERVLLENLQRKHEHVVVEKNMLKEDNAALERQNESLTISLRAAKQKNVELERENSSLQDKASHLQSLVDDLTKKLARKTQSQQSTKASNDFIPGTGKSKLTKLAQQEPGDRLTVVSEMSGANSTSPLDLPQQDNITFESDFTRESTRQLTQESKVSMPTRAKSRLSKMAYRESGDKHTIGSEMSVRTTTSQTDLQMQDDYTQQIDLTQERQPDSDQENMTSALFIDDITLDSTKRSARKQKGKGNTSVRVLSPILSAAESTKTEQPAVTGNKKPTGQAPVLTQSAKRVLDNLCREHECSNCVLCTRINARRPDSTGKQTKKTVRVECPVPASSQSKRQPRPSAVVYEDQPTLRPSQNPAIALAKVMKGLKDEEKHLRTFISRKQAVYDECDAAVNKRLWKQLAGEIKTLQKRRDLKRDQIYDLQDVLEGQKSNSKFMSQEAIDMTINSVLSRDPTWDGIIDY